MRHKSVEASVRVQMVQQLKRWQSLLISRHGIHTDSSRIIADKTLKQGKFLCWVDPVTEAGKPYDS